MEEVIRQKRKTIQILEEARMCTLGQVKPENQRKAFSILDALSANTTNGEGPPSDEDIKTGSELFFVIVYCPTTVTIKLFRFVDQLLSSESSRTIIQSFVNLFRLGAIKDDETALMVARQFFYVFASSLNLQFGNVLLATSTNAQLQAVIRNDWPFFANNTEMVEKCLQKSQCDIIQDILQKLGIELCVALYISYY